MGTNSSSLGQNSQEHIEGFGNQHIKLDFVNERGKFVSSGKVVEHRNKLIMFMEEHIYPMESELYKHAMSLNRWIIHSAEEKLKELAKTQGLWNLFIRPGYDVDKILCHSWTTRGVRRSYFMVKIVKIILVIGMANYSALGYQILNMDIFVRSWAVLFGLHRFLTVNCGAADTGKHGETVIIISSMEENGGPVGLWIQGANFSLLWVQQTLVVQHTSSDQ